MSGPITAWSFSRWKTYSTCPLKAKLAYIDKIKEPSSPQMERGSGIHKVGENFLNGVGGLCKEYDGFTERMGKLRYIGATPEDQWTFTSDWAETGWFASDAWCRMGIDAHYLTQDHTKMVIVDFKTGKVYDDSKDQLGLYALGAFTRNPELQDIEAQLWYLDQKQTVSVNFSRTQFAAIKGDWERRTYNLLHDTIFPARPGQYCKRCFHRKANGGSCIY